MQRKEFIWIAILVVLGAIYVHFFTHWFDKRQIVVTPTLRPAFGGNAAVYSVAFSLNDKYNLKNLKVVPLEDGKFNPNAHTVWHLVGDSASTPTQMFMYGRRINGMKQAPDNPRAEPLQAGVTYRMVVSAGGLTGYTDFKTRAMQSN